MGKPACPKGREHEKRQAELTCRTSKIEKHWRYDSGTDTLTIIFADAPVAGSDEDKPGVILDYDTSGNLVSLEILDAPRRIGLPTQIEYQVLPSSPS